MRMAEVRRTQLASSDRTVAHEQRTLNAGPALGVDGRGTGSRRGHERCSPSRSVNETRQQKGEVRCGARHVVIPFLLPPCES